MTIEEAAALLNVDWKYVVRLVKNGEIPFIDTGWEQQNKNSLTWLHCPSC
ncbi:MAG: excisionase family DNA-binding protein [Hormoscilla sp. GM102CHS1]|nr:excisionase family DNA-binding protein [Hormoscilla sp. GM102CHS1]